LEPFLEPQLLELEVGIHLPQLGGELDRRRLAAVERVAQKPGKLGDRLARARRVGRGQAADDVEGVEEEVGVDPRSFALSS
jgi:hypothetical protein